MILPTRKLLLLLLVPAGLLLFWRSPTGLAAAIGLDAGLVLLALLDLSLSPGPSALRIERVLPRFLSLDAKNPVGWDIRNTANRAIHVQLTEDVPAGLLPDRTMLAGTLRPQSRAALRYTVRPTGRGRYTFGDLYVRCTSQLGLVIRQQRIRRQDDVKVYPNVQNLRRYELAIQRHRLHELGLRSMRDAGKGSQFEHLRDYLPGDDIADIAWKATARRGKLIVRQYGVERSQNILLMLDCGRLMTTEFDGLSRLDYAINAAILLTYVAMKQGDSVGLLAFSDRIERYLPATRGQGVLTRVNEALYSLEARLAEADYDAACRFLALRNRKRSLIVLFTDVIDDAASAMLLAHTMRFARHHVPLCVTLRNREIARLAELSPQTGPDCYVKTVALLSRERRHAALQRMRSRGVGVLDVDPHALTPAVVNRYLELKRTQRI